LSKGVFVYIRRVSEAKARVVSVFGRAADLYDEVEPRHFSHFGRALVERADLADGVEVLDVATGKGAVLFPVAERARRVVGIDLAEPMIHVLRKAIARGAVPNATATVMDAENLEFADSSFDAVLCGFAVFMFREPARALAEFHRVLRPGGIVGLTIFGKGDERWQPVREMLFAHAPAPSSPEPPRQMQFRNAHDLRSALEAGAFRDVRTEEEVFDAVYTDADQWLSWAWSHGYREILEQLTDSELEDFKAEVYPRMEMTREADGRLHNRLTAIYGYGVKSQRL